MNLSLIVALSENNIIGVNNTLPWNLPNDLKRFKSLTTGKAVIMGRKTFESIGSKPLPNRLNIVVTRNKPSEIAVLKPGVDWASLPPFGLTAGSLTEAVAIATYHDCAEAFVIGGVSLFAEAFYQADKVYATVVHGEVYGDVVFPIPRASWPEKRWHLITVEQHSEDNQHAFAYSFVTYES